MRTSFRLLFALCIPAFSAMAARSELPAGSIRAQKMRIIDAGGFGSPMTAVTLLAPVGWTAMGGVVWDQKQSSCGKVGTRFEWRAAGPDGVSAIEILPQEAWSGHNLPLPAMQQSCPNIKITTAKEYLPWYASRVRPGARILDYRDRGDMIKNPELYNQSQRGAFGEIKTWAEGGEVLLAFQVNGREVRESLAVIVHFSLNRMPGVMPGEIREFLTIGSDVGFAVRAPAGQLDFTFAEMVRRSITTDPTWSALMAEHNRKMAGISAKGAAARQDFRMKTAQEIAEINRQGYEARQASNDRSQERFNQAIRGVESYVVPGSNERTELPNTHNHVWRLNDGTYLLTNDVNLQPNRDLGIEGQQLEIAK
ncbi:MAG: hypothetical protein ABIO94_09035 [Opitutaceae bacterium]